MRLPRPVRTAGMAALLAVAMMLAGCELKTIHQIRAEPDKYADREVGIAGRVVRSYSVLGRGVYEVDDGTGKLWVVSEKGVPRTGAEVAIKGKIKDGFDLGSVVKLPEAISAGMVMIESSHKAR